MTQHWTLRMSCGTPSPASGAQQVTHAALSTAGMPKVGRSRSCSLREPQGAPPLLRVSHTHGSVGHSPVLLWDCRQEMHVAQAQQALRWLCHVPHKAPSASGKLVAMSCSPACTIPWGYPGAGLDLCVWLTLKFQSTFSFRLLRSF